MDECCSDAEELNGVEELSEGLELCLELGFESDMDREDTESEEVEVSSVQVGRFGSAKVTILTPIASLLLAGMKSVVEPFFLFRLVLFGW